MRGFKRCGRLFMENYQNRINHQSLCMMALNKNKKTNNNNNKVSRKRQQQQQQQQKLHNWRQESHHPRPFANYAPTNVCSALEWYHSTHQFHTRTNHSSTFMLCLIFRLLWTTTKCLITPARIIDRHSVTCFYRFSFYDEKVASITLYNQ